ncbi:MAG: cysteine desulfurase [Clostridia bacterium]|nr:cysteine desulfurase [Clostridia bacterium]
MKEIYFDNSATTKISKGAMDEMVRVMQELYGNPSSLHNMGLEAEKQVEKSRKAILEALGISRGSMGELIFTSGGTESNNLAILGSVYSKARRGNEKILATKGEHASVENTLQHLEKQGFRVVRVPTLGGVIDLDFVRENAKDCILATFMNVNNETGAVYDVKSAFDIVRELSPTAVCHSDCVQSFMKLKISKKSLGADLISLSAHKINGAKGVGALYVDPQIIKTKRLVPVVYGGGQEYGFRSGTENVYGIVAFGVATREHFASLKTEIDAMREVREYIVSQLEKTEGVFINRVKESAPHIISMYAKGIRSETMLHLLSSKGIYVSSGSACSSNSKSKVNTTLEALGLTPDQADSTIRISLSPQSTKDEADALCQAILEATKRLARK